MTTPFCFKEYFMLVEIKLRGKYRVPGQAIKVDLYEVGTLVEYIDLEYGQWLVDGGYASLPDDASGTKIVSVPEVVPELPAIPAGQNLEQAGKMGKTKGRRK